MGTVAWKSREQLDAEAAQAAQEAHERQEERLLETEVLQVLKEDARENLEHAKQIATQNDAEDGVQGRLFSLFVRRDNKLRQTGHLLLSDSRLSDIEKTAWAQYRQQLRDLTATFETFVTRADVDAFEWPTPPK